VAIARSLLGCTAIAGAGLKELPEERKTLDQLLAVFMQNGAYNSKSMLMGEMTRVVEMFGRIAQHPDLLRSTDKICALSEWMLADYGFSVEEQLRIGFAVGAMSQGLADGEEAGQVAYLTPEQVTDLLVKMGMEDRRGRFFDLVSADRSTLRQEFAKDGGGIQQVAWERRLLMRRPFLRCANGGLMLLSPRAMQAWMGDGFYYRLLDAARRRSADDPKRKVNRRFTAYAGQLLEVYTLDLVRSVYAPEQNPISGVRVYGEQRYGPGGQMRTSDVAVLVGEADLVLIEVSNSRIRASTLVSAAREDTVRDVQRMLVEKIGQLDKCVTALRSHKRNRRASIPAESPAVDMHKIKRIWPVVVTAGNVTQSAPLWDHVSKTTAGKLTQRCVQPLTLLSVEDYEVVCYLIEHGHGLIEVLTAKTRPPFAQRELAIWLRDDPSAPKNISGRPKLVERTWHETVERITAAIDFTKGEPQAPAAAAA
jgi:hypothetical protein